MNDLCENCEELHKYKGHKFCYKCMIELHKKKVLDFDKKEKKKNKSLEKWQ